MDQNKTILTGKGISIGYKKNNKTIEVAGPLSFDLKKGKLTCLLGPNGVGKSTLIRSIMGQIPCLAGEVLFREKPIQEHSAKSLARQMSVVLTDKITAGNLTVGQLVSLGRTPFTNWLGDLTTGDKKAITQAMEATKTLYLRDYLISEISDGQLQKVMIARALAQDGDLIILDEPTAHLDLINRYEIMHLLREITQQQNKTILVVTHDLDIAIDSADELWLMQCGEPLICGCPEDLILSGEINRLLPNQKLIFDPNSGKIRSTKVKKYPNVIGPEPYSSWLKQALSKNNIPLPQDYSIYIKTTPLQFKLQKGDQTLFSKDQIASLIEILKGLPQRKD
ncbi:ABC transporter ATP-binding protein [Echinicola jeungdonensis]|uniref:ABC transporter ATP-binding protein n=1 Tax=Echinicola jeungdonensis TaxID=709343 RepID=A0ABV5J8Y0_9BACT|nr:ABC transporter ATP-binding protein [Echinicola jeungdonensis]MDN3669993.1 ABC transporter ATP-binding protein [Echinicola jeungdonensis]